jgi:short-subunit dehydrogenase
MYNFYKLFFKPKLFIKDQFVNKDFDVNGKLNLNLFSLSRASFYIALQSCKGNKVGYPAFGLDLTEIIRNSGKHPVLIEADKNTFNIDINKIPADLDILVCTHTFGNPVDVSKIKKKYPHLIIIEDCVHALTSSIGSVHVGQSSEFSIFSYFKLFDFYMYNQLQCLSLPVSGSILFSKNPIQVLQSSKYVFDTTLGKVLYLFRQKIKKSLNFTVFEYLRMSENLFGSEAYNFLSTPNFIENLIFTSGLKKIDAQRQEKQLMWNKIIKFFNKNEFITPQKIPSGYNSTFYVFGFKLNRKYSFIREKLVEQLLQEGIAVTTLWHNSPVNRSKKTIRQKFPIAQELSECVFAINTFNNKKKNYQFFSDDNIEELCDLLCSRVNKLVEIEKNKFTDKISFPVLKNKTILITGGSSFLGQEIIKILLSEGVNVIAQCYKSGFFLDELKNNYPEKLIIYEVDFSSTKSIKRGFFKIKDYLDGNNISLDVMIQCVGTGHRKLFSELHLEEIEKYFSINLFSYILGPKILFNNLSIKKALIINIGSQLIDNTSCNREMYVASKAGIKGFSRSLASDLYFNKIKVLYLKIGYIASIVNGYTGLTYQNVAKIITDLIMSSEKHNSGSSVKISSLKN